MEALRHDRHPVGQDVQGHTRQDGQQPQEPVSQPQETIAEGGGEQAEGADPRGLRRRRVRREGEGGAPRHENEDRGHVEPAAAHRPRRRRLRGGLQGGRGGDHQGRRQGQGGVGRPAKVRPVRAGVRPDPVRTVRPVPPERAVRDGALRQDRVVQDVRQSVDAPVRERAEGVSEPEEGRRRWLRGRWQGAGGGGGEIVEGDMEGIVAHVWANEGESLAHV
mmetsp:Transcript_46621/g.98940  ORF Transcript_46621/g.98940 Transcript_46621/m.98940 type:complete len:220 (-) Transcript_46621:103-762(-)